MFGNNHAHRYRLIRAGFVAGGLLLLLIVLAWNKDETPIAQERIVGRVLTIEHGEAISRRTQSGVRLITVIVELPDGNRTRVMVPGAAPEPGSPIHLLEERHGDGSRRYVYDRMAQIGL